MTLRILKNNYVYAFFRIHNVGNNLYRIWCFSYEPIEKEYSYNAIMQYTDTDCDRVTLYNMGALGDIELQINNQGLMKVSKMFVNRINELIEENYGY